MHGDHQHMACDQRQKQPCGLAMQQLAKADRPADLGRLGRKDLEPQGAKGLSLPQARSNAVTGTSNMIA